MKKCEFCKNHTVVQYNKNVEMCLTCENEVKE